MNKAQTKKAANQANSNLRCISCTGYALAKEIVSLLSLQLMYSYLNELTLYALEFYIPSLAGIAFLLSLTVIAMTSLGHSVTCTFLVSPFFTAEMFWDRISILFKCVHVDFPATQIRVTGTISLL